MLKREFFIFLFLLVPIYLSAGYFSSGQNDNIKEFLHSEKELRSDSMRGNFSFSLIKFFSRIFNTSKNKIDDTVFLQSLLNDGGFIDLESNRTYIVSEPLHISIQETKINGNGALIRFEYEQSKNNALFSESLFVIQSVASVEIRNIRLEYRGTYDLGTNTGMVSGVYVEGSSGFIADGIEAFGFNRAGLNIGVGSEKYNDKPLVINCYLHNNRVAGCLYGNNESGVIKNNRFYRNGLIGDTGTGYGFTGWSATIPKNTKVLNNEASFNVRKGLDFHAGIGGEISGNICDGNLISAIYVTGVTGEWLISNNDIKNMKTSGTTFGTMTGIEVGNRNKNRNPKQENRFEVTNNKLSNFKIDDEKIAFPVFIHVGSIGRGSVNIMDNTFEVGKVTCFIKATPSGRHNSEYYDTLIEGNFFSALETTSIPIYLKGDKNRTKIFSENHIEIENDVQNIGYIFFYDKSSIINNSLIATNNIINVPLNSYIKNGQFLILRDASKDKEFGNQFKNK